MTSCDFPESKNLSTFACKQTNLQGYICQKCQFSTHFLIAFKQHTETSPDVCKIRSYSCSKCNFETNSLLVFLKHTSEENKDLEEAKAVNWFHCSACTYSSRYKANLKGHIRNRHWSEDKVEWFKCDNCNYQTKYKHNLENHYKYRHLAHDQIEWFKCSVCSYKSKFKYEFMKHIDSHNSTSTQKIQCLYCGFMCANKSSLHNHIKNRHTSEDKIKWRCCPYCDYRTKHHKHDMNHHILCYHTKEEDLVFFKCEHCNYKSKSNKNLKSHVKNKHECDDNKCFKCDWCPYRIHKKSDFLRHLRWCNLRQYMELTGMPLVGNKI